MVGSGDDEEKEGREGEREQEMALNLLESTGFIPSIVSNGQDTWCKFIPFLNSISISLGLFKGLMGVYIAGTSRHELDAAEEEGIAESSIEGGLRLIIQLYASCRRDAWGAFVLFLNSISIDPRSSKGFMGKYVAGISRHEDDAVAGHGDIALNGRCPSYTCSCVKRLRVICYLHSFSELHVIKCTTWTINNRGSNM